MRSRTDLQYQLLYQVKVLNMFSRVSLMMDRGTGVKAKVGSLPVEHFNFP